MKAFYLALLSIVLICSCQSSSQISKEYKANPCQDLQYLKLQKMKVKEMTGSEMKYFKRMEKECNEFNEEIKMDKSRSDFVTVLIIAGVVVGITIPLLIFSGH